MREHIVYTVYPMNVPPHEEPHKGFSGGPVIPATSTRLVAATIALCDERARVSSSL